MTPSLTCENCGKLAEVEWRAGHVVAHTACRKCVPGSASALDAHWIDPGAPVGPSVVAADPLTVAAAASREQVSERTIRRMLAQLAAEGGAWKIGATWRIDPGALDRRRSQGPSPRARRAPSLKAGRKKASTKNPNPVAWE